MDLQYVSNVGNLVGGEFFEYTDGSAKGVRACRLFNGKFDVIILLDKAMNIFRASYRGENIAYVTKNGLVSPMLSNTNALPFLQSFDGGLLYTCGLENIGAPKGTQIQHGRISNCPAENVRIERSGEKGDVITLVGQIRQAGLFTQNLLLTRRITMSLYGDEINIKDTLSNEGFSEANYAILYHFNLGYPLISEKTKLSLNGSEVEGINDSAKSELDKCFEMQKPTPNCDERVYCHTLKSKRAKAVVKGDRQTLTMEFDTKNLSYLVEWKSMASQDYVLGIEPSSSKLNENLKLQPIPPQEEIVFEVKLTLEVNKE